MMDIKTTASNLLQTEDGLWISKNHSPVSYPQEGMDFTYQLEEQSYWFQHRNKCIIALIEHFRPQGALFDIGGGNGFVSQAVRRIGIETVLVEPDPTGSRHALERGLKPVINATLDDAGFTSGSMDAVGLFDVLEHIEDDGAFLQQIHELVKPGGRLFITVPAYLFLWSIDDVSAGHFRRYSLKDLCQGLKQAGFQIDFATYIFMLLPLPIIFFRTLPSRLGWRKKIQLENADIKNEYVSSSSLVETLLGLELPWLKRLISIPIGGSCLVAASRMK
jgi:2-polyprenyl-3-methyl-5-hydroxy-6-metoxy-1,4-benzoquinol methylase